MDEEVLKNYEASEDSFFPDYVKPIEEPYVPKNVKPDEEPYVSKNVKGAGEQNDGSTGAVLGSSTDQSLSGLHRRARWTYPIVILFLDPSDASTSYPFMHEHLLAVE